MRRMLDPTKVGGLPSTIEFDKDGNRTADKDLKVNGKLKLQSLVSNTNPDGDITKELGGGGSTLYCHSIKLFKENTGTIFFNFYSTNSNNIKSIYDLATAIDMKEIICSGIIDPANYSAVMKIRGDNHRLLVSCLSKTAIGQTNEIIDMYSGYTIHDTVRTVE